MVWLSLDWRLVRELVEDLVRALEDVLEEVLDDAFAGGCLEVDVGLVLLQEGLAVLHDISIIHSLYLTFLYICFE